MDNSLILNTLIAVAAVLFAPILGGLITGADRILTARMQGRKGPPLLQPFYDVIKLFAKKTIALNQTQMVFALGYLLFTISGVIMLALGQDLLMLVFVLAFAAVSLITGAMSLRSPYSKIGAQREIIQLLSYEPMLILMAFGVFKVTGSFEIGAIFELNKPLIFSLPLVLASFLFVLPIKLRKSPFDFSTSHHGHQELVKGITTEFSGIKLAIIEITHWYEVVLLIALITLYCVKPLWLGILIALVSYLGEILIDNISARVTWKLMLRGSYVFGIGFSVINLIWLYLV